MEKGSMCAISDLKPSAKFQPVSGHMRPSRFSTLSPRSIYDLRKAFKLTSAFNDDMRGC
jgi:hypothetical protein